MAGIAAGAAAGAGAGGAAGAGSAGAGLGAEAGATGAEAAGASANPVTGAAPTPTPSPTPTSGTKPEPDTKPAQGTTDTRDFSPPKPRPGQSVQSDKDEEKDDRGIEKAFSSIQGALKPGEDKNKPAPEDSLVLQGLKQFARTWDTFDSNAKMSDKQNTDLLKGVKDLQASVDAEVNGGQNRVPADVSKKLGKEIATAEKRGADKEIVAEMKIMQKNYSRIIPLPMKDTDPKAVAAKLANLDQIKQVGKFVAGVGGDAPKLSGAQAENAVKFKASPLGKDAKDEDIAHVAKHGDPQQQKTPEGMQGLMKAFQGAKDEFAKPEHGLDPKQQLRAAQFAISPAKKDLGPKDIAGAIQKAPPLKDDSGKKLNNTQFGQVAMAHKAHEGVMAALKSATEGLKQAADAGKEASKEQKAHASMGPRPGGR